MANRQTGLERSLRDLDKKVYQKRSELGLSFRQLSKLIGVAPMTLYRVEDGHTNISLASYVKIDRWLRSKQS